MTHFPGNEQPMLSSHDLSEEHPPFAGALLTALWSEQHQELCTAPATPDQAHPKANAHPRGLHSTQNWLGISIKSSVNKRELGMGETDKP